jgi:capsule polysaccharide export protein KpsE/RkpR
MDSAMINKVEDQCLKSSFHDSTKYVAKYREQLKLCPSAVIQARIEFDAVCEVDLATLSPLQMQRLSTLKRELIKILS